MTTITTPPPSLLVSREPVAGAAAPAVALTPQKWEEERDALLAKVQQRLDDLNGAINGPREKNNKRAAEAGLEYWSGVYDQIADLDVLSPLPTLAI